MFKGITPLEGYSKTVTITPELAKEMLAKGFACAWTGCKSNYKSEMPKGWRCIAIFKEDILDGEIDGVLCPLHITEFSKYLKSGYALSLITTEESRSSN